jgi:hypothetical protein
VPCSMDFSSIGAFRLQIVLRLIGYNQALRKHL